MIAACDIGMIFLDHRFTIPNFPSRLLAYMQAGLPVLACTDPNTDIGTVVCDGEFGWWCESKSVYDFCETIRNIMQSGLESKGFNGRKKLLDFYSSKVVYDIIINNLRV